MAKFPRTEPEVLQLARAVAGGLKAQREVFPNPPVGPDEIEAKLDQFNAADAAAADAAAKASQLYAVKAEVLRELIELIKSDIRYAENTVNFDHHQLQAIGWGGRKPRTPLQAPGQTLALRVKAEGPGWVRLAWKKPADGGGVAAYVVKSRKEGDTKWRVAGTAAAKGIELTDQESGVELLYCVVAINKAGEGPESGVVSAVL